MIRGLVGFARHNALAMVALFLALGGTTYAASTSLLGRNTVASPQVVNGSLQTVDLSRRARAALKGNRGPRGLEGARGPTGAQGAPGAKGDPGASATKLFATVKSNGTLINGSGVTSVSGTTTPYHVVFNRDVSPSKCTAIADDGTVDNASVGTVIAIVVPTGPFGGDPNAIDVYLRDLSNATVAGSFHLAVFC
jgi:hypothetical protein